MGRIRRPIILFRYRLTPHQSISILTVLTRYSLSFQIRCNVCGKVIHATAGGHLQCRAHTPCTKQGLYSSYECDVCSSLWEAADVDEVDASAVDAYKALQAWVVGYRKNARGSAQPVYIWQHDRERREFAALTEDLRVAPYVVTNKIKLGAFPVKAQPPSSPGGRTSPTSETLSAIGTVDVPSSSDESTSAAHRRF